MIPASVDAAEFGAMIRRLREHHKLSQDGLAQILDIDRTHLSNIERGKSFPSVRLFIAILDQLGYRLALRRAA